MNPAQNPISSQVLTGKEVVYSGKTFVPFLSNADLTLTISEYTKTLNVRYADDTPVILTVLSGAYRLFAEIVLRLEIEYQADFIKLSSYGSGTESSGTIVLQLAPVLNLKGRKVIVLEDIVDTGRTSDFLFQYLQDAGAESIEFYSLLFKETCFEGQHRPTHYGFSIPPVFVIGFGMDLAEEGRCLPEVFQLKTES